MKKQLLLLLMMLLPMATWADSSGTCGDNLTWTYVEANQTLTISGSGDMQNYTGNDYAPWYNFRDKILNLIIYEGVSSIGNLAFSGCSGLTSVTIPNSVTSIGGSAFSWCHSLTSVKISDVAAWYNIKFEDGGSNPLGYAHHLYLNDEEIKDLVIPNNVTSISDWAFCGCFGLTSVTIPNSVTSIGRSAFYGCSGLTSLTIPNSVTSIGDNAFKNCTGLTTVTIHYPNIGSWFSGNTSVTEITIGDEVTSIDGLFDCIGSLTCINVLPGNTKFDSRDNCNAIIETATNTLICGCKSTIIPNSVTSIGFWAFNGCSGLTSVTIPNSVTSIGSPAFSGCSGLTSVNILDISAWCNIKFEGLLANPLYYAHHLSLNGDEIKDLVIPDSVTSIGSMAFSGCSGLTSVTIGNNVTSIDSGAFDGCTGLTSVTIPNSVTSIGSSTFKGCSGLTSVKISDIAAWCNIKFDDNPLWYAHHLYLNDEEIKDLVIPNSVTSIGFRSFFGCSGLTSLTIPNNVTSIGNLAFSGCSGLTSVTIPNSVTSIGSGAFSDCTGLTSVTIPNSVTSIDSGAFDGCTGLTSVTIPNSVTSIGSITFRGCSGLTSVTIPNSVTSIGQSAFRDCPGLTSVTIPNSVTSIGNYAFSGCSGLTSVTIPNSVTSIGVSVFRGCIGLASISVESGNEKYDSRDNCNAIISSATNTMISSCKNTIIPNSVTSIGSGAFDCCFGLTSLIIPNSVTSIGGFAFQSCSDLISVTIGNSVTSIGYKAFYYCYGLTNVYCYAEQVPKAAIGGIPAFEYAAIANTTLHVPAASIDDYKAAETWKEFGSIVALTDEDPNPTGITNVNQDCRTERQYYSLDGKRSSTPQRGLNIVKMSNGTTRKVIVK